MARRKSKRQKQAEKNQRNRDRVVVTRAEQERAGYKSPRAYSDALTDLENRGRTTQQAVEEIRSKGGREEQEKDASTSLFKDSATYKSLSAESKSLVNLAFSTFTGTEEEQQIFANALVQAQAWADPYAKSQLMLFEAEFQLAIAKTKNDYEKQKEILERTRTNITAELKLNEDVLNLEQQADLAKELKGYDEDLLTIAETAEAKGLTFATGVKSRVGAEKVRAEGYQDVVQSTQRQYNFRIRDIKRRAEAGDLDAQKQLENLPTGQKFTLQSIGQEAERVMGSERLRGLGLGDSFTPQGGALGSIEQERRQAIINAARLGLPQ